MKNSKLEREILKKLKESKYFLKARFGVKDIAIFGSFINNTQSEYSDIDINVDLSKKFITYDNYIELKEYLESILNNRIDLVINGCIRKELKNKILSEATYV